MPVSGDMGRSEFRVGGHMLWSGTGPVKDTVEIRRVILLRLSPDASGFAA